MAGLDGLELQDRLKQMGSILPIVFLTGHGDLPTSVKAIKAGAEDFLSKPVSKDTLLEAVERALALYRERHDQRSRLDHLRALVSKLTPRESEVFALIVRGRLNKQIAYELGTSERTIKAHRHAVMEKLRSPRSRRRCRWPSGWGCCRPQLNRPRELHCTKGQWCRDSAAP